MIWLVAFGWFVLGANVGLAGALVWKRPGNLQRENKMLRRELGIARFRIAILKHTLRRPPSPDRRSGSNVIKFEPRP